MLKERLNYLNQILKAILFVYLIFLVREWTYGVQVYHTSNDMRIWHQNLSGIDGVTIHVE